LNPLNVLERGKSHDRKPRHSFTAWTYLIIKDIDLGRGANKNGEQGNRKGEFIMGKKLFTSFTLAMCMALVWVVQVQAQVTIDKNGDMHVEKGLKGSFPGSAIVIDGDGYLNIETGLKGKAAPVERTGQTESYATGDDGNLQRGAIWPNPRFTDNGNGTVTDNLTGLIWLKDANCFGPRSWTNALSDCNSLGAGDCGLTDGSSAGDWRLPNRKELDSLLDFRFYDPALSNTVGTGHWEEGDPFTGMQLSDMYWSSTTLASSTGGAWGVGMGGGYSGTAGKGSTFSVFPVRGGQ